MGKATMEGKFYAEGLTEKLEDWIEEKLSLGKKVNTFLKQEFEDEPPCIGVIAGEDGDVLLHLLLPAFGWNISWTQSLKEELEEIADSLRNPQTKLINEDLEGIDSARKLVAGLRSAADWLESQLPSKEPRS